MKGTRNFGVVVFVALFGLLSNNVSPQSLSSGLGATKLNGLKDFSECQNQSFGHHEKLIADRLETKLAKSAGLTAEERGIWAADIQALRQVAPSQPYRAPDAKNPQHYLLGLTDDEQVAINSMHSRFVQELNLACEHKYGGMTRYSQNADQSGQARYEQGLRSQMQTPIDIASIPAEPLPSPFPKSRAQLAEERRAAQQASRRAAAQQINSCAEGSKGLRLSIMADKMQQKLNSATSLSAGERADFDADIRATKEAAAKGLDQAAPVDPSNPNRALMRLTPQEQLEIGTEFANQYMARMKDCVKR